MATAPHRSAALALIRTDASSAIGLGHLRRCLSLAAALRELGAEVRFAVRASDVDAVAIAAADGFAAQVLATPGAADGTAGGAADGGADSQAADAQAFLALWPDARPAWVVLDHYRLGAAWQACVRQHLHGQMATIDDLADRPLDTDVLIDHNLVPAPGHRARYLAWLQRDPAAWLCGPRFALLGPAYRAQPAFVVAPMVRSIGIFLGGTDPAGLSAVALQACRSVAGFSGPVELVSTLANPALAALRASVASDPNASLTLDLPHLAGFFRRHDLQIGAGGGATWERCCVGVPTLTLCAADNQRAVIPALQALGVLVSSADNQVATVGTALLGLINSQATRQALSEGGRALVDGRGAQRVAVALLARSQRQLTLHRVTPDDAHRLWCWRNHPATRAVSRQAEPIPWPAHQAWLARILAEPNRHLWLAHLHNTPVGLIRFEPLHQPLHGLPQATQQARHEVSLYLDPGLHGLGLGSLLLDAGEQALAACIGPTTVHAEVLADNPASRRLFSAAGYRAASALTFTKTVAPSASAAHSGGSVGSGAPQEPCP